MLLEEIAKTSAAVAASPARLAKVETLAACLRRLRPEEIVVAVAYLSGELPHAPIGVGWAALREPPPPAPSPPTLDLLGVDTALRRIGTTTGPGSQVTRRADLRGLLARATEPEQRFLVRLLLGDLRQGALEGVMVEAVARAAALPAAGVRRALMLAGSRRRRALPARAAPADPADARADGRRPGRGAGTRQSRRGRVEARRRPPPGAPAGE